MLHMHFGETIEDGRRGKGVSGMQAEQSSVNGCKLQGGERDKYPASVLNGQVDRQQSVQDIGKIIHQVMWKVSKTKQACACWDLGMVI